ncbi:MAG: L-lactate dehydrogenase [Clostridiales bacterium]|jgi:L-lactate dehydrogenase|nr:L-lactate dehydrogenase [Clostridiales bacterium]
MMVNNRKITILGAGNVGATIAYTLTIDGLCSEIVLIDVVKDKAMGEAMDISQGLAFNRWINIHAGDYCDAKDSDIVIVSMGIARRDGQSRIELAQTNVDILKSVIPQIVEYAPKAVYIVVSNPVDILTYSIIKSSGIRESKIIGSGTLLDSSRLRSIIAKQVNLTSRNIHAYVLGEHGDSSVIPWSIVSVSGMPIIDYCRQTKVTDAFESEENLAGLEGEVRNAGAKVIKYKRATYYAIAMTVKYLCEAVLRNTRCILTVSTMMHGEYGLEGVAFSVPTIIDSYGAGQKLILPINKAEKKALEASANFLKSNIDSIKF